LPWPEDEARRLPLDEIVMVIDAQMPVRAKRIQYFDDRLFKAIHAAQTGELPFPKPGGGEAQGTLPLSVRAMPMTPPSDVPRGGEADVDMESASQVSGGYPSGQNDGAPKKTAPVVQAVVAEEQRQMEMDFFDENSMDGQRENADVQVFETALKNLGMLEARISEN
jgi:type IV secretion system protein VirD4